MTRTVIHLFANLNIAESCVIRTAEIIRMDVEKKERQNRVKRQRETKKRQR